MQRWRQKAVVNRARWASVSKEAKAPIGPKANPAEPDTESALKFDLVVFHVLR